MTRPGIEPRSPGLLVNILPTEQRKTNYSDQKQYKQKFSEDRNGEKTIVNFKRQTDEIPHEKNFVCLFVWFGFMVYQPL